MITEPAELLKRLIEGLRLLAADYEIQAAVLPNSVHKPDEVAMTFGELFLLGEHILRAGLIDDDTYKRLRELNALLDRMSDRKELWTMDGLRKRLEWTEVRHMARDLLRRLGMPVTRPNLYWIEWE